MIREEEDGLWNDLDETIAFHHDDVFAALTTADGLRSWFPIDAKIDLRRGGQIVFCWDKNCTKTSTVSILDYDAGGRIVWDWYADHTNKHAPVYWNVLPSREKGAIVKLHQGPFTDDRDSLIAMATESSFWQWHMCNLRSVMESRHDMRMHRPL